MASVGALGIGLSIVFGVFLVLLLAELYYLLFWKRKSLIASSRVTSASVAPNDPSRPDAAMVGGGGGGGGSSETAFVAKMFESRGLGSQIGMMLDGAECVLAPPRLLFTIKEEAREDLVDSAEDTLKSSSIRLKRGAAVANHHVVLEVIQPDVPDVRERERGLLHVCSSSSCEESGCSSSSGASEDQDHAVAEISHADHPPLPAVVDVIQAVEEGDEMSSATPFVTPPSSPAFSTPPSSPDRPQVWRPPRPPRLSYESPPSPPLRPMPVPTSGGAPPPAAAMTPLSVSSSSPGRRSSSRATASACSRDSFSSLMRSSRQSP